MNTPTPLSQAMADVLDERRRQIAIGLDATHDDAHKPGELARAAAAYIMPSVFREVRTLNGSIISTLWPWYWRWWKPKDRRADLVRGAALTIAEIEKLDRAAAATLAEVV